MNQKTEKTANGQLKARLHVKIIEWLDENAGDISLVYGRIYKDKDELALVMAAMSIQLLKMATRDGS